MSSHANPTQITNSQTGSKTKSSIKGQDQTTFQFKDNRNEAASHRNLQEKANNSSSVLQLKAFEDAANGGLKTTQISSQGGVIQRFGNLGSKAVGKLMQHSGKIATGLSVGAAAFDAQGKFNQGKHADAALALGGAIPGRIGHLASLIGNYRGHDASQGAINATGLFNPNAPGLNLAGSLMAADSISGNLPKNGADERYAIDPIRFLREQNLEPTPEELEAAYGSSGKGLTNTHQHVSGLELEHFNSVKPEM